MINIGDVLQINGVNALIFEFIDEKLLKHTKLVNKLFYRTSINIQTTITLNSCSAIFTLTYFKHYKQIFVNINFRLKNNLLLANILENQNICGFSFFLEDVDPFRYYPSSAFDKITTLQLDVSNFSGLIKFISKFKKVQSISFISQGDPSRPIKCNLNNCSQIKKIHCNNVNPKICGKNIANNIETAIYNFKKHVVTLNSKCISSNIMKMFCANRINILFDVQLKKLFMYTNSMVFKCDTLNIIEHLTILPLYLKLKSSSSCVNAPNLKSLETCDSFETIFLVKHELLHLKIICFENTINVDRIGIMLASYKPKITDIVVKNAKYPSETFKQLCVRNNVRVTLVNPVENWSDFHNRESIYV